MQEVFWVHNIDPVVFHMGSFQVHYYSLFFAIAMIQGAFFWTWQIMRSGRRASDAFLLIWLGIFGVIIGGRVVHVVFYRFEHFISNPTILLTLGRGGLASHGSGLGLLVALWLYARKYKMALLEVLDRISLSVPLATSLVRLGNFFNSEIVGRPSDVPWAVIFSRYDLMMGLPPTPRHPSQLYEVAIGIIVFAIVYLTDRRMGESRPQGLMAGLLVVSYFSLRFLIEFFKNPHVIDPSFPLTMGQILSIPFIVTGLAMVIYAHKRH